MALVSQIGCDMPMHCSASTNPHLLNEMHCTHPESYAGCLFTFQASFRMDTFMGWSDQELISSADTRTCSLGILPVKNDPFEGCYSLTYFLGISSYNRNPEPKKSLKAQHSKTQLQSYSHPKP